MSETRDFQVAVVARSKELEQRLNDLRHSGHEIVFLTQNGIEYTVVFIKRLQ